MKRRIRELAYNIQDEYDEDGEELTFEDLYTQIKDIMHDIDGVDVTDKDIQEALK